MAPIAKPLLTRLLSKVTTTNPSACWEWTAEKDKDGYGTIQAKKLGIWGKHRAHRISYDLHVGPIPDNLVLRHSCDNPSCINPKHLLPGTASENVADCIIRGRNHHSKKTHCTNGHEFTQENTYRPPGRKERACRTCLKARKTYQCKDMGL